MKVRFLPVAVIILAALLPLAAEAERVHSRLPMHFEENRGQTDERVRFFSRGNGYSVFLAADQVVLSIGWEDPAVVRMKLVGQNADPQIEGLDPLMGTTNYLLGSDPNGWRKDIPSFSRVRYGQVYPGIDVVYYGNGSHLQYDFVVAPQADPDQIHLGLEGIHNVRIDRNGDLVLKTAAGEIRQSKPFIYQEIDGERAAVDGGYVMKGKHRVGFKLARYDRSKPLVIDPVLVYSSYLGGAPAGATGDMGLSIAVDAEGNAYITGHTGSPAFPIWNAVQPSLGGAMDAFVIKLDPTGTVIIFSTFIGGSGRDQGNKIALDNQGNILLAGFTSSADFPAVNAAQPTIGGLEDGFVMKLNNSGTALLYSTFLGGVQDDRAVDLAVDEADAAYLTGFTSSRNFPTTPGALQRSFAEGLTDLFVTKLNAGGGIEYSTYIGGIGHEEAYGIDVDAGGNAYVVGLTTSINFPVTNETVFNGGSDDAFVLKLNPAGNALVYSTYLGGIGSDIAVRVAVDAEGSAHVSGMTSSINFPVFNAWQSFHNHSAVCSPASEDCYDAFLTKFTPDGTALTYSTFLGGFGNESGAALALDADGGVYIAGFTNSFDFPGVNAIQVFPSGQRNAYLAKFSADGQTLIMSTLLGGSRIDGVVGLAVDSAGDVVLTGFTTSEDFPIHFPFQPELGGGQDGFVTKIRVADIVTSSNFQVPAGGGTIVQTGGMSRDATFGYAMVDPGDNPRVNGLALVELRQFNALTSLIGMPAPEVIADGRMLVDTQASVNQVISWANLTDEDVLLEFFFTDEFGTSSPLSSWVIGPQEHFSRFITDAPFAVAEGAQGTFTFSTSVTRDEQQVPFPLPVLAFRTRINERNEQTISVAPIADLNSLAAGPQVITQVADGGGYNTEIVLINTGENRMNGEIRFYGDGTDTEPGQPLEFNVNGVSSWVFEYDIPPRSFNLFRTLGGADEITDGWVHVVSFEGFDTPHAAAVVSYFEFSLEAFVTHIAFEGQTPGRFHRIYAAASGHFEKQVIPEPGEDVPPFQTLREPAWRPALAFANPSSAPVLVRLELVTLSGTPSGFASTLQIPPNGHRAFFLHHLSGFEDMPVPFEGLLHVSTDSPSGIAVNGAHTVLSERDAFLMTGAGPLKENAGFNSVLIFPHMSDGGGFTTRFIMISSAEGLPSSGTIRYVDGAGRAIPLTVP